jgi:hypothetical protein
MAFVETFRVAACRIAWLMALMLPVAAAHGGQHVAPAAVVATTQVLPAADDFARPRTSGEPRISRTKPAFDTLSHGFERARRTPVVRLPKRPANPLATPSPQPAGPVFKGGGIR